MEKEVAVCLVVEEERGSRFVGWGVFGAETERHREEREGAHGWGGRFREGNERIEGKGLQFGGLGGVVMEGRDMGKKKRS
ncbi:uncharacterized protein G2W53_014777 [Senna tora]|uniref:Uncharacterized protein n=1 Tax=Senna tora TaxID=362788 RepID=A0A834WUC2_9FABA|nr:uncharacterized protein G2W53_014777 [Senna tora]